MRFEVATLRTTVSLKAFSIEGTYAGAMEGSPQGLTAMYRRSGIAEQVIRCHRAWDPLPVHVLDPGDTALPPFQCVAYFSWLGDGCSRDLLVCWFIETMDVQVRPTVEAVLGAVDWSLARTVSFDDY